MPKPAKLLYLLTDGGRARFVARSPATGQFTTVEEIDHTERLRTLRKELRASPAGRSFSSTSPRRAGVGPEDYFRPAKEAFMAEVAERAAEIVRREQMDGVFMAAPARLVGPLRLALGRQATITGALRKDLTKAPDHELGAWLAQTASAPQISL